MKKTLKIIYIALFFTICAIPSTLMFFYKNDGSAEKRSLAEMPPFINDDKKINTEFTAGLQEYFDDRFAFRNELITAKAWLSVNIYGVSSGESVIAGKDGWLFFEKTLNDYLGHDLLSEKDISDIARTLEIAAEYCEKNGAQFVFTVAPNKNTVYPGFMPGYYVKETDINNLAMLKEEIIVKNINYCDLLYVFSQSPKILYHKFDSHWTNEGAMLAYNSIMDSLNLVHESYFGTGYEIRTDWDGDLYKMLYPAFDKKDEQYYPDISFSYNYTSRYRSPEDIQINTENNKGTGKLLMFRDSFGNTLHPFMAEAFSEASFSRAVPYRFDMLQDFNADAVVLEIVERNIPMLKENAPVLPAPLRDINTTGSMKTLCSVNNTCKTDNEDSLLKIYGALDDSYFEGISRNIYIQLQSNGKSFTYEAFVSCDSGNDGYCAYIDTEDLPKGEYSVNVLIQNGTQIINTGELNFIHLF